jgi:predicted molibdopterin-dependent oxidoreductase YjgC
MEIKVNGTTVAAAEGSSLLQAAEAAGFRIPTLCHHPALAPASSCRVCVVEGESPGRRGTAGAQADVLANLEFQIPGGSVKEGTALSIIEAA